MEYIVGVGISFIAHKTIIADTEFTAKKIAAEIAKAETSNYNIPGYRKFGIDLLAATPREEYEEIANIVRKD